MRTRRSFCARAKWALVSCRLGAPTVVWTAGRYPYLELLPAPRRSLKACGLSSPRAQSPREVLTGSGRGPVFPPPGAAVKRLRGEMRPGGFWASPRGGSRTGGTGLGGGGTRHSEIKNISLRCFLLTQRFGKEDFRARTFHSCWSQTAWLWASPLGLV